MIPTVRLSGTKVCVAMRRMSAGLTIAHVNVEVIAVVVLHGADDAQVVNALTDVRQKIADLGAGLPVRPEVPLGSREILASRRRFSVIRDEFRLGIERIDVRDAAAHVQKDHSLGSGRKVRRLGRERIRVAGDGPIGGQKVG